MAIVNQRSDEARVPAKKYRYFATKNSNTCVRDDGYRSEARTRHDTDRFPVNWRVLEASADTFEISESEADRIYRGEVSGAGATPLDEPVGIRLDVPKPFKWTAEQIKEYLKRHKINPLWESVDTYVRSITKYYVTDEGLIFRDNGLRTEHWLCGDWVTVTFRLLGADPPYTYEISVTEATDVLSMRMRGIELAEQKKGVYRVKPWTEASPAEREMKRRNDLAEKKVQTEPVVDPAMEAFYRDRQAAAERYSYCVPNPADKADHDARVSRMTVREHAEWRRNRDLAQMADIENARIGVCRRPESVPAMVSAYKALIGFKERK